MRPDIQALPNDPATAAYCSVVLLDSRYNNPIGKVANEILRKILEDVRRKRLEKRRSSRDLRSIVLNPMAIVNSQKNLGGGSSPSSSSSSSSSSTSLLTSNSKRIVNRWWLYAMLATHPVLSRYRHREEEEKKEEKVEERSTDDEKKEKKSEVDMATSVTLTNTIVDMIPVIHSNVVVEQQVSESSMEDGKVSNTQHSSINVTTSTVTTTSSEVNVESGQGEKMSNSDEVYQSSETVDVKTLIDDNVNNVHQQAQLDLNMQNRKSRVASVIVNNKNASM
jgi:hypothetical protein